MLYWIAIIGFIITSMLSPITSLSSYNKTLLDRTKQLEVVSFMTNEIEKMLQVRNGVYKAAANGTNDSMTCENMPVAFNFFASSNIVKRPIDLESWFCSNVVNVGGDSTFSSFSNLNQKKQITIKNGKINITNQNVLDDYSNINDFSYCRYFSFISDIDISKGEAGLYFSNGEKRQANYFNKQGQINFRSTNGSLDEGLKNLIGNKFCVNIFIDKKMTASDFSHVGITGDDYTFSKNQAFKLIIEGYYKKHDGKINHLHSERIFSNFLKN